MLGLDLLYICLRVEDAGELEDPVLAHVQHQLPSALDLRRLECGGGGGVPARDPSVSVSERQLLNFVSHGNNQNVDLLQEGNSAFISELHLGFFIFIKLLNKFTAR